MRRYLAEIYATDAELLIKPTPEELTIEISIFKDRISDMLNSVLSTIANNTNLDASDRLEGFHLAAEMSKFLLKLNVESPTQLARFYENRLGSKRLGVEQRGLYLTVKRKEEEERDQDQKQDQ